MTSFSEVSIVHGMPDTNSGGAALGISLVKAWENAYPNCRINYISTHKRKDLLDKAYPYIRLASPALNIIASPLLGRSDFHTIKNTIFRRFLIFLWGVGLVISFVYLIFPKLACTKDACNAIERSDVVLSRGTQIFYDKPRYFFRGLAAMYSMLFPLLYAWRVGTPFVIYAQTFGPLHRKISKAMLRFVFNRAFLVLPREKISKNFLITKLGIQEQRIILVPDSVFGLKPVPQDVVKSITRKYELPMGKYMSVTIRQGMYDQSTHLFEIAEIINKVLAENVVEKCAIVTQCHSFDGYAGFESDSEISEELYNLIDEKDRVILLDDQFSPENLLAIYGGGKLTLGMRLHSVIFSLIEEVPAIAISYWGPKTQGIMDMAGLKDYVFDVNNLQPEKMLKKIKYIVKNSIIEKRKVRENVERLNNWAMNTPQLIGYRLKESKKK